MLDFLKKHTAEESGSIKRKREGKVTGPDEIFKRSNKLERTPPGVKTMNESKKGDMVAEEIKEEESMLIVLVREIKVTMMDMRKEVSEMKDKMNKLEERWKKREVEIERRMDSFEEKMRTVERHIAKEDKVKERTMEEETQRITEQVVMRVNESIGRKYTDGVREEIKKMKRVIEEKERKERKNKIVIRGLRRSKGVNDLGNEAMKILEMEFGVKEKVKEINVVGSEGREVIIAEMVRWEDKEGIMKRKEKLVGSGIYIDHDLTREERSVQRKLREIARREREEGRRIKVGYRKIIIEGKTYRWSDEEGDAIEEGKKEENRKNQDFV